jgi:hypothetical protein
MNAKHLVIRGAQLFSERKSILTLWQDIAENFYPQRADFTLTRHVGQEFAQNLYSSYPIIVHRELSTALASMLRPRAKEWFSVSVDDEDSLTQAGKEWLGWATKRQRQLMYDRHAHFIRATTEGDADFAAFGQCCISHEINWNHVNPHLLFRSWHLRDVAWSENESGAVDEIYVKWKPMVKQLAAMGWNLHENIAKLTGIKDLEKVDCMRLVISTNQYKGQNGEGEGYPWMIVYLDTANNHIMHEQAATSRGFTLPRWQTVSGSQYAYAPSTVAGLPDARLLQAMSLTLLEAGEMSVRPPMIATQDAIRGDVQLFAGGITWADVEYDERKGDVLRPITQDRRGLPQGYNERDMQMQMLAEAFYINKLTLPPPEGDMTAFEVGQRVEEYVRAALPLFEPMEHEYNGQLCEDTFDLLLRAGAFGSVQDMPRELQGREVHFKFVSPLHDAIERKDASIFMETRDLLAAAMELDPTAIYNVDMTGTLRAALEGVGLPAKNLVPLEDVQAAIQQANEMQAMQQEAELATKGGQAARDVAQAEANMAQAQQAA